MTDSDQDLIDLRNKVDAANQAGFQSLCLLGCGQGFNGPECPRCWPPTEERMMEAARFVGSIWEMKAASVYAWICGRLGATRNKNDERLWMAVRSALDAAVKESTWKGP